MRAKRFTAVIVLSVITAAGFAPLANAAVRPTTAQKLQLQYIIEEEKLARDVYLYLAENVTTMKFPNIAKSEQTHMDQIAAVLKTYNYFNPTLTRAPGVFRDKTLQALYNTLIAQGSVDVAAAMQVGRDIENLDIKDLQVMLAAKTMPADMTLALNNLLKGSINHLAAFSR
jgi:hypothetical protein